MKSDLYRSSLLSAFALGKGYSRPLTRLPQVLREELLEVHKTLQVSRKLTHILRLKAMTNISLVPRDLAEVFATSPTTKRGKWSLPKLFLDVNRA